MIACGGGAAGGRPGSARRVVEFGARDNPAIGFFTACDEHLAAGQQRRRVVIACGGEAAGLLKLKRGAPGRLDKRQPRTEKKQLKRDSPRNNRTSRPKNGT